MKVPIAVIQCELSHLHNPPHIGPSLLVQELESAGHPVHRWYVNVAHLESAAIEVLQSGSQLAAIDSIFPTDVVRRFKERLGTLPVVVGGTNALPVFEKVPLEFAIVGPARRAIHELAAILHEQIGAHRNATVSDSLESRLASVPNLFFRTPLSHLPTRWTDSDARALGAIPPVLESEKTRIDCSTIERPWNLEEEILPFAPPIFWNYLGPSGRHALADRHGITLIPEWGCPYQKAQQLPDDCANDRETLRTDLYTDRAWDRVATIYLDDPKACSFCIFRYQEFTAVKADRSVELLLEQFHYYWSLGIRSFAIQSENPFRLLRPFLDALEAAETIPEELRLRTMVRVLKAQEKEVLSVIERATGLGIRVAITQVGFESFVDRALTFFNKGVSNWENRWAAQFLQRIHGSHEGRVHSIFGHGLILFDPFTTIEELLENLQAIEDDAPFLKTAVQLDSKLYLYSPYAPIARIVRQAGLLRDTPYEFGLEFDYADPEIPLFLDLAARGMAPLMEAIGRMRLDPPQRQRMTIEGRFRWFRALADYIQSNRKSAKSVEDCWGQVLASVTGELGAGGVQGTDDEPRSPF